MILDRLTHRAVQVILAVVKKTPANFVAEFISEISKADGVGKELLSSIPTTDLPGSKRGRRTKTLQIEEVVKKAYYFALLHGQAYVGTEHLLLAVLSLIDYKNLPDVQDRLSKLLELPKTTDTIKSGASTLLSEFKTPLITTYGTVLNHTVYESKIRTVVQRKEYEALVSVLLQKKNPNPLIVGEAHIGKKSLIELLVRKINAMEVPPALMGYRVIEFDLLNFVTNIFNKGVPEISILSFFDELKSLGRVILVVKNFQSLFYSTNMGVAVPLMYSAFKAGLEESGIKCIATISDALYTKLISDNEHIIDNFSIITLSEPDENETLAILKANAKMLSDYHSIEIPADMLAYTYKLCKDELPNLKFPQKAIDLLDHACSHFTTRKRQVPGSYREMVDKTILLSQGLDKSISLGHYEDALKLQTEISDIEGSMYKSEKKMFSKRKLKLSKKDLDMALEYFGANQPVLANQSLGVLSTLNIRLAKKIIGQDEAVDLVAKSLVRSKLGLRPKKRPLGSFLFLGPTGVGKTELAKVLADEAFGDQSLIRLDMSDFSEKHTVARLVGAPPGYVGYGEGGELTSKIDIKPDSVVLFDEIEKAHPDVLNILLQIMEEGELVDAKGAVFDFSRSVVILTSNLGTDFIHAGQIGYDEETLNDANIEDRLKSNLKKILKPELLNRIDEVVVFRRLTKANQKEILRLYLEEVATTLIKQNVKLKVSSEVKDYLLKEGYSEEYGARALRRTIEKKLLDKIAEILLVKHKRPLHLSAKMVQTTLEVSVV